MAVVANVLLLFNACSLKYGISSDIKLPPVGTNHIPLRIGLYLSPNIFNYTYEEPYLTYQMGRALSTGTENMLRLAFKDVIVLPSANVVEPQRGIDAYVVPEVVHITGVAPLFVWHEDKVIVRMKYSFTDSERKIIWEGTFQGEVIGKGSSTKAIKVDYFKSAIEKQLADALTAILSSRELRLFAAKMAEHK